MMVAKYIILITVQRIFKLEKIHWTARFLAHVSKSLMDNRKEAFVISWTESIILSFFSLKLKHLIK